jgi:hypothetical protein
MSAEQSHGGDRRGFPMKTANFSDVRHHESYVFKIDEKIKSECGFFAEALRAGLEIKQQFPQSDVKVHNANE